MTRPPTFRVAAREAPADLRGDEVRAFEASEYRRCVELLAAQILAHDAGVEALAERDADGAATLH